MAILPQHETDQGRHDREVFLECTRQEYEWQFSCGQPPHVRSLPSRENFSPKLNRRMTLDAINTVADVALGFAMHFYDHKGKLDSFDRFYLLQPIPAVAKTWSTDVEFARQRLDGLNPLMIECCKEIPENFPVTDETVAGLLAPGETLESAIAESRLFLLDFHEMHGVQAVRGRFLCSPMALFYVGANKQLMPIAIQLGQSPAEAPVIFTPKDPKWIWLTAKTHLQSADGNYHEIMAHLLRTHMVMETIAVALNRQLSDRHPLNVLMRPHFQDTMAINSGARLTLLAPGGPIDTAMALGAQGSLDLIARGYRTWTFDQVNIAANMRRRGVLDPEILTGYHFRDDALKLWHCIESYVDELLRIFYPSDEDIRADYELQAWAREVTDPDIGRVRGFPGNGKFETRSDLHDAIAQIMFVCSCEHSAVNNGQYDLWGYVPNAPGNLYLPAPRNKIEVNEENLVYALPDPRIVGEQIMFIHLLSERTSHPLGTYPKAIFDDDARTQEAMQRFRARLADISKEIQERNRSLEVPYTFLDPPIVARSIAI